MRTSGSAQTQGENKKRVCYADMTKAQYTCARYLTLLPVRAIVPSLREWRRDCCSDLAFPPVRAVPRLEMRAGYDVCFDQLFIIQKMTRYPIDHRPRALRRRPFRRPRGPLPVLFVISSKTLSHSKRLQDGSLNWRRLQWSRLQEFWFVIPRGSVRLL